MIFWRSQNLQLQCITAWASSVSSPLRTAAAEQHMVKISLNMCILTVITPISFYTQLSHLKQQHYLHLVSTAIVNILDNLVYFHLLCICHISLL